MARFLTALVFCFAASVVQAADKLLLSEISSYLNGLTTVRGTFTQINEDGTLSTGELMIKRPGKMRFEYDPPDATLVVACASAVFIHDRKSNQPPSTYPLNRTPLSLILAPNVNLNTANMVVGHHFDGTATRVVARDPEHPEYGRIEMLFTSDPVALRKWVVYDANGGQTTVMLGVLEAGVSAPNSLFCIDTTNDR
ncbi:MAG: outer membrane lipoprotein carrier protein LolA [Rhodobacteraceae bacterium]|nr:outer membrane lipoprotein carrier protein LolA [Paracoccaceae bacterium]